MDGFINQTSSTVTSYFDSMQLISALSDDVSINTTVFATSDWKYKTTNGSSYAPGVGYLGLAKYDLLIDADKVPPGVLEQVKSRGIIGSKTVSMHLASAKLQQSGSFILGGYDKSRVIGPPGVWTMLEPQIMAMHGYHEIFQKLIVLLNIIHNSRQIPKSSAAPHAIFSKQPVHRRRTGSL